MYAKKVDSAVDAQGSGDGWFKLWHEGYDEAEGKWCTQKLRENDGLLSIKLPKGMQSGDYLLRPEVIALHIAMDLHPEIYLGCAQIFLESSGTLVPDETVSIPGHLDPGSESIKFNIYQDDISYPLGGPDIATFSESGTQGPSEQTSGLKPEGCFAEIANFCPVEYSDYSTKEECFAVEMQCWADQEACYDEVLSGFHRNCVIMKEKCKGIKDTCRSENPSLPNPGEDLTPAKEQGNIPEPYAGAGSSSGESLTDGSSNNDSSNNGSSNDSWSNDDSSSDVSTSGMSPSYGSSYGSTAGNLNKDTTMNDTTSEDTPSKETSDDTAPEDSTEDDASEDTAPKDDTYEDDASEDAKPEDSTYGDDASEDAKPEDSTYGDDASEDTTPEDTTSEDDTSEDAISEEVSSDETTPDSTMSDDTTSDSSESAKPSASAAVDFSDLTIGSIFSATTGIPWLDEVLAKVFPLNSKGDNKASTVPMESDAPSREGGSYRAYRKRAMRV